MQEIDGTKEEKMNKDIIFFDLETNGINKSSSVLSIAALKYKFDGNDFKLTRPSFIRYYFRKPPEKWDVNAQKVHGLTDEIIDKKRDNSSYELFFYKDQKDFNLFCQGVTHFVGHNIAFDQQFITNIQFKHTFCTMLNNENIVKVKKKDGTIKWPSLKETAVFYKINLEEDQLHDSLYDISITFKIFEAMYNNEETKKIIKDFLNLD